MRLSPESKEAVLDLITTLKERHRLGVTAFERAPWMIVEAAGVTEIATDASSGWGLGAHWGAKLWK